MNERPFYCSSANTENCKVTGGRHTCSPGEGVTAECSTAADNQEIQKFLENARDLNASLAIALSVSGERTFSHSTYAPVEDTLFSLDIADFDDFDMSLIRSLRLPVITHMGLRNCANVVIGRDDFWFFPRMTRLVMDNCTVDRIEQGAFNMLPLLRQISLDGGIPLNKKMSSAQKEQLRLLHCDCQYRWLRVYLEKNPNLIAEKQRGEVFTFSGTESNGATIRDVFAPVDCSKDDLIGEMSQIAFSVNDPCL